MGSELFEGRFEDLVRALFLPLRLLRHSSLASGSRVHETGSHATLGRLVKPARLYLTMTDRPVNFKMTDRSVAI
jgi:hypothetical protein